MKSFWMSVLLIGLSAGLFAADALPRYKLPAGKQLSYTVDGATTGPMAFTSHDTWTLTVLAENKDGSRSVLADGTMTRDNTGEKYGARKGKSENHITFTFETNTRGQLTTPDAVGDYARAMFFPLLPANTQELGSGWLDGEDKNTVKDKGPAKIVFELNHPDPVYNGKSIKTVEFDAEKGVVAKTQREFSQDYGMKQEGTETLTLSKDDKVAGAALEDLRQFLVYAQAQRQYKELCEKVYDDPARWRELLTQAGTILNDAAKKVTNPEVLKAFERSIKGFPAEANSYAAQAQKLVAVLNKPAADFSVTDFDGATWSKEKLKGSVIVLDFWYRGCGWCMKAIPQLKEVVAQFKDKPVHILGVNVDEDEEDGKLVIKTMDLHYPQLKGKSMAEAFGVSGYPTLIVIDQEGIVRTVHFGYSTVLKEKLWKKIDLLLSLPAGK
jgi:thiol-disulfide isomerase/thioredoxin